MGLDAGLLRHTIRIEEPVTAQDPVTGSVSTSWQTFMAGIPCSIEPLSVKDFLQSDAMQSEISVRITFRYISGLNKTMRIVGESGGYVGQVYNPAGFLPDKESGLEYITAPCSDGVNEGDF